jgi:hypothetical protein
MPVLTCPVGVSSASVAAQIDVSGYVDHIWAALAAHRSQIGAADALERMQHDEPDMFRTEYFLLGGVRAPLRQLPVKDLFLGLFAVPV